jgi:hypothetical protein
MGWMTEVKFVAGPLTLGPTRLLSNSTSEIKSVFWVWCLIRYRDSFSFVMLGYDRTKYDNTINPVAAKLG